MNKALILLALLIATSTFAQQNPLNGYFIKNNNDTINCFLILRNWNSSPKYFEYKLSENGPIQKIESSELNELVVKNKIKYVRHSFDIDPTYLSKDRTLSKIDTTKVLLQQLVEGDANLYSLPSTERDIFLYSINGNNISYLMYQAEDNSTANYHMYSLNETGKKQKNDYTFRSQLLDDMASAQLSIDYFSNLKYDTKELIKLFTAYNSTTNQQQTDYTLCVRKKSSFRIRAKAGLSYNQMKLPPRFVSYYAKEVNGMGYQAGVDLEVLFGRKNIWAISFEPMFLAYDEQFLYGEGETASHIRTNIDYFVCQLPISARNYLMVRPNWSAYIQLGLAYEVPLNAQISTELITNGTELKSYNIKGAASIISSIGCNYQRFGCEYRYEFEKDLMKMTGVRVNFLRSMISLSYRL
ncbi:hypothetical protein J1N10_10705 [Carboxylicivirga sp. A043]|uniref:PorT family protein n=1 Tax=Carboxylicivirga litoralis TaxID=2816963 RepID=UPI0021CB4984|nr:PorT family protein [Carboxylicivirga sp. A043]MCU4156449.1 hypothetical protein [Carboxylicivirga sp. A043]